MKYFLFFILLLLFHFSGHAWTAYYPNGSKVTIRFTTIKSLLDSLGVNETTSSHQILGVVYFKRLSNKPLFVFFPDKEYPNKIQDIIKSYDYSSYIYSYSYYWDAKNMIDSGTLTKEYLKDVFGEPDVDKTNEEGLEAVVYRKYNLRVEFKNGFAKAVNVINYNAISKNQLSILKYEVTGEDYSIGFNISLSNLSAKTIKYSFITVTATNPVDDKVGTKTVKAIGPINQNDFASYEFENTFYSRVAEYLSIDNIKIQYMDGTIKNIPKSEIRKIRMKDWEAEGQRTK